jgi:hypothetical protein
VGLRRQGLCAPEAVSAYRDQADRAAIASHLMRYRDQNGQGWADIIDFLTKWPDARRHVVRVIGEVDAGDAAVCPDILSTRGIGTRCVIVAAGGPRSLP